jgi:hypothetical protein
MTTIDLIDVFFRQSIIGIDPIDVFLTIGAHLCQYASEESKAEDVVTTEVNLVAMYDEALYFRLSKLSSGQS